MIFVAFAALSAACTRAYWCYASAITYHLVLRLACETARALAQTSPPACIAEWFAQRRCTGGECYATHVELAPHELAQWCTLGTVAMLCMLLCADLVKQFTRAWQFAPFRTVSLVDMLAVSIAPTPCAICTWLVLRTVLRSDLNEIDFAVIATIEALRSGVMHALVTAGAV